MMLNLIIILPKLSFKKSSRTRSVSLVFIVTSKQVYSYIGTTRFIEGWIAVQI